MEIEQNHQEINQAQPKDHAGVLAKVKKAISMALMTGMLASPMAAKDMKNAKTYQEPTRVERSAEQNADMLATYNNARKLFQTVVDSKLNRMENLSAFEKAVQGPVVESEVETYINQLADVLGKLNNVYNLNLDIVEEVFNLQKNIEQGKIRSVADCKTNLSIISIISIMADCGNMENKGINGELNHIAMLHEYLNQELPQNCDAPDYLTYGKNYISLEDFWNWRASVAQVSEKNGVRGNLLGIRNHPEQKALGMAYISKNVQNISTLAQDSCGKKLAIETLIWTSASIDAVNEMINDLEKVGYKFNENNLKPQRNVQQQADLGMER